MADVILQIVCRKFMIAFSVTERGCYSSQADPDVCRSSHLGQNLQGDQQENRRRRRIQVIKNGFV